VTAGERPPALEVVAGPALGLRIEIEGQELRLGRAEPGDGNLGEDPELSRRHASLRRLNGGGVEIEDHGSRNGTFVNGERVATTARLEPGDEISVGGSVLRLTGVGGEAVPRPERRPALRVVAGWAPGAMIQIGGEPVVVGRGAAGAAALGDDAGIAEEHVKLTPLEGGRLLVEDLGSERGTSVGGSRIAAPTIIAPGDRIEIGGATLEAVEAAGTIRTEPRRAVGEVRQVPEGLFAMIAARAPVSRDEVLRVTLVSLGWAAALNLIIRTLAIEGLDVPDDLKALEFPGFAIATVMPVVANAFGFYKTFRRPDERAVKRYLAPTFGVPLLFVALNLAISNHFGALEVLITLLVTVLPMCISAPLMLRLRERVARERVLAVRGAGGGRLTP
jgi:pSer/pThr/pTyr-binding forkhead associated (FHA) protein